MKKIKLIGALFLLFSVVSASAVYGADDVVNVTVNGTAVNFAGQGPVIYDGRTLVPVRGVFEQLGFEVIWDEDLRQAVLMRANDTIVISVGSDVFTANGENHTLDVPAQIIGERTMLPIRAVLESAGFYVSWDYGARNVAIKTVIITIDEYAMVTRPEVDGLNVLTWNIYRNGEVMLRRGADGDEPALPRSAYQHLAGANSPGTFEIYLSAFVAGRYVAVSNTVSYVIGQFRNITIDKTHFVPRPPFTPRPKIENPAVTITINENNTVTRPKAETFRNVRWVVRHNGIVVLERLALNELTFTYSGTLPGFYEVYLQAFFNGGYFSISNTVSYVVE